MMADNHFRHDQYDIANRTYHENLVAATEAGASYWAVRARDGIAWVLVDVGHYTSGEFEEADRIFSENLPVHREVGNAIAEAMGVYGLSRSAAGMGDYDRAVKLAQCSVEILKENDGDHLIQLPILQLANICRDHGSFEQARPYYEAAIEAADRNQDSYLQVLIAFHYGMLLKWMGDAESSAKMWSSVLPEIAEFDFPRLGSEICSGLSQIAANREEFREAYQLQIESQRYGNRVGVISRVLQNQQMLLRSAMDQTARLEQQLSYLTAGVEASEDGIFVLGPPTSGFEHNEFAIQFANAAAAQMVGKRPVEILHVLLRAVWKSPTAARIVEPSVSVYETGNRCSLDPVELEFREGEPRWYAVKIARITDGVAWTVSDVTERETMRREILAQRDRLEEANTRLIALDREKTEVLGIAAHDLRSPICNIRSLCDFIPGEDPVTSQMTSLIGATADSLLSLLSNLLDLDRIERGQLELEIREHDLLPISRHIVEQFSAAAHEKEINVRLAVCGDSLFAMTDESSFRRVLQNLLSNALKFSPSGSEVEVRAMPREGKVRFEIQDQGPGISAADRKSLFGRFARLSARPTAGESSSGLGLSIVKHLVTVMNGRVGCDSVVGQGATFWFEL